MKKSIYELMRGAVNYEGRLDPDFELPEEDGGAEINWAPGALDGVMFYHGGRAEADPEDEVYKALTEIIHLASEEDMNGALSAAEAFAEEHTILPYADELLAYIVRNQQDLEAANIVRLSYRLITEGTLKEAVKLGFVILALFQTGQSDFLRRPFRILGLSDEFTLYAAFNMVNWDDGNDEIFELLQKVKGWGRVHLVRMLEADTEEKKLWLLEHGVDNQVMPAYSALDSYRKTDFMEHLKRPLAHEVYQGMADIVAGLLDEGPVPGISAIEEREEMLGLFLEVSGERDDLNARDYEVILDLIDYLGDETNVMTALLPQAEALIDDEARAVFTAELKQGKYFGAARRLGLPYEAYAYEAVMKDLESNAWWAAQLIKNDYRADELLAYIEDYLKAGEAKEPDKDKNAYWMPGLYDFVLEAIRYKPGTGEIFVAEGLSSEKRRIQNGSVKVLQCWLEESGKTLKDISPDLHEKLAEAAELETDPKLKEEMLELLDQD